MNSQKIFNWIGLHSFIAFTISSFAKIGYLLSLSNGLICFSASMMVMPIAGAYASLSSLWMLIVIRFLMSVFLCKATILTFFATHYLAGFGAALAMRFNHWIISVLLPASCMVLFIMHPVAGQVWFYSLYWLIPMIIYVMEQRNWAAQFFGAAQLLVALRSTFIAHAVGSVVWAYLKPMTIAHWQLLLPIVALERCVLAGAIAICCISIDWLKSRNAKLPVTHAGVVES